MFVTFICVLLVVLAANSDGFALTSSKTLPSSLKMGLDPVLSKAFPRDFSKIPLGTDYGEGSDAEFNKELEAKRITYLENELYDVFKKAVAAKERPMFTTALIAGDNVILDALAKLDLLDKVPVVFIDTFTLFPESISHMKELENHYNFKALTYNAVGCKDQEDYYSQYGRDYWMKDIDQYDMLCKVEPMNRALKEQNSDCWINGRRRDHGAERAALPVWEGKKLNPLAMWSFEDCWSYLRKHNVPYHPLHDVGFSSLGDMHSTKKVEHKIWFTYGGERSGRFQNLVNKDGSSKTECGIHTEIKSDDLNIKK